MPNRNFYFTLVALFKVNKTPTDKAKLVIKIENRILLDEKNKGWIKSPMVWGFTPACDHLRPSTFQ